MRLIDADALKERIRKALGIKSFDNLLPSEKTIVKQIDMASTIQPDPHWIPVTERLPEEDVDVLCQTVSGARLVASYGLLNPWHKEKGWITSEFNRLSKEMIEAWMPLPEPFNGATT